MRRTNPQHETDWLTRVGADWRAAQEFAAPPEWVINRAKRLFRNRASAPLSARLVERIRATLLVDSRRRGLAAVATGVRAASMLGLARPSTFQLLYRGADLDVDILVRPHADGRTVSLRGQALTVGGDPVREGQVEVLSAPAPTTETLVAVAQAPIESSGEFNVASLAPGTYSLLLHLGRREIELPDIEL